MERLIEIVDYDVDWPAQFEMLRQQYERALAGVVTLGIEHVVPTPPRGCTKQPNCSGGGRSDHG